MQLRRITIKWVKNKELQLLKPSILLDLKKFIRTGCYTLSFETSITPNLEEQTHDPFQFTFSVKRMDL